MYSVLGAAPTGVIHSVVNRVTKSQAMYIWVLEQVGCWLLVVGCWLLVVGCWLLVVGCWLLVVVAGIITIFDKCWILTLIHL